MTGLAPSVGWLDGGSLTASAWHMGVAHPPGEPGWLAPARLAMLLPVGDIAFRASLLSALSAALCALPLLWLGRAVGGDGGGGLLAVGLALLGFGARMQAHRAEVYAPVALLLVLALAAAVCWRGARASGAIGFLLGAAAGVHPLLAAAAAPAVLVARWLRSPFGLRDAAAGLGFGVAGFAVYGWLPLRAMANPSRAWGVPDSPSRFLDVLLGRTFAANFGGEGAWLDNVLVVAERHALSGLGVAVLLAGAAWVLRREDSDAAPRRALAVAAPLWVVGNALTILPQNKAFGSNPDVLGYLFVGTLAVAPLAALGVARLRSSAVGTSIERLAPALVATGWIGLGVVALDGVRASRSGNELPRTFATSLGYGLPPGTLLMTSGNNTAFLWTHLQGVERRRADLVVVHRVLLGHEHERRRLAPDLSRLGVDWRPELRANPAPLLAGIPAAIEARAAERPSMGSVLTPHGLVWQTSGPPESDALRELRTETLSRLADSGDDEAVAVASWALEFLPRSAP